MPFVIFKQFPLSFIALTCIVAFASSNIGFTSFFPFGIRFIKVWYDSGFHFNFFLFILQIASAFENSISNSFNFNHTKRIESDENVIQRQYYHEISGQTTNTLQTPETQQKTNSESCMCIFFAHNSARFISYVWKLTLAKNTMLIGSVFLVNCKKLPTDNFPQQKSLDVPFFV